MNYRTAYKLWITCSDVDQFTRTELAAILDGMSDGIEKLRKEVSNALEHLENAPFDYRNGNEFNGVDEGEHYGWSAHADLVKRLKDVLEETK